MDSPIAGNGLMRNWMKRLFALLAVLSSPLFMPACGGQSDVLELNGMLSAMENQTLVSKNGLFAFGFVSLGDENERYLSIWYTMTQNVVPATVVWMPSQSRVSYDGSVTLSEDGELILYNSMLFPDPHWALTGTKGENGTRAVLTNTGNLVLYTHKSKPVWQSFHEPTNTLLPHQRFTAVSQLISWSSSTNPSPGPFYLVMQSDQNLVLYTNSPGRPANWSSGTFVTGPGFGSAYTELDDLGSLTVHYSTESGVPSSVAFKSTLDHGRANVTRRVSLDIDGNIRMYSWNEASSRWLIAWSALSERPISPSPSTAPSPTQESPSSANTDSPPSPGSCSGSDCGAPAAGAPSPSAAPSQPPPSPASCSGSDCGAPSPSAAQNQSPPSPASCSGSDCGAPAAASPHPSAAHSHSKSKPVIFLVAWLLVCVAVM